MKMRMMNLHRLSCICRLWIVYNKQVRDSKFPSQWRLMEADSAMIPCKAIITVYAEVSDFKDKLVAFIAIWKAQSLKHHCTGIFSPEGFETILGTDGFALAHFLRSHAMSRCRHAHSGQQKWR